MSETKKTLPEFNYGPDDVLAKLSFICFLAPIMYANFYQYLPPFLRIAMIPGFIAVIAGLYLLGRLFTKIVARERVEYAPEKSLREYIVIKKSWLGFLGAIAVGVAFFFIALAIKNWFWQVFDDKTQAHAKGYVYEIICGAFAFFVTYFSSILWFLYDGMFLPADSYMTFGIAAPFSVWFIMRMFIGLPKTPALVYTAILVVLFIIRRVRIRSYVKMVEKIEKKNKYLSYRSKYDE